MKIPVSKPFPIMRPEVQCDTEPYTYTLDDMLYHFHNTLKAGGEMWPRDDENYWKIIDESVSGVVKGPMAEEVENENTS